MRILVVSNLYPPIVRGGYEMECADIVARLGERHEVTVLTSRHRRGDAPADPHVLRELDLLPEGARGTLGAPPANVRAARTTRRVLATVRPEAVLVCNGAGLPASALRIVADAGLPLLFRVNEYWFAQLFHRDQFMRHLDPSQPGHRTVWAPVVRAVNRLPALRLDANRPMPCAVLWATDTLREMTGRPAAAHPLLERSLMPAPSGSAAYLDVVRDPRPGHVGFLGRLDETKGIDVAIAALGDVRTSHGLDVRLVAAGWGSDEDQRRIADVAARAGVAERLELRGPQDPAGVRTLLAQSAVLIVPSIWDEPTGTVLLEGAAARVPLVVSRVGGMHETMRPDEHALFFARGDSAAAADAIAATLTDDDATARRVDAACAHARATFAAWGPGIDAFVDDAMRAFSAAGGGPASPSPPAAADPAAASPR